MDRRVKSFIKELEKKCSEHNVELLLLKGDSVPYSDSIHCTGYFDEQDEDSNRAVLACALGDLSSVFVSTLVHESCHLDQWLQKAPVWGNNTSCGVVDLWLEGTEVKNIKKHLGQVRDLELDCERRTSRKIVQYDLPINVDEYIQKANSYIHLYNYIGITRKWATPKNAPYKNENIWRNMPRTFRNKDYYKDLTPKVLKLFNENKVCGI